ncbi:thioredoxin family protein [Microlunatus sp. Gsoil 973]|uniref:thioredoxin family protein n=1 Tax=Microlunatus sp. Gsoil 973 TaxID=2672569 RepID=UPI0012B45A4C|nr:thioredoxin family protein [Microlunatus sp. Gsoil 973]QGN34690.1 thioredoxin [Microlunatus sp. Gsoil 973]
MWVGWVALLVVLLVTVAFVGYRRRTDGRFRAVAPAGSAEPPRLTEADLGRPLGRDATVVQFSSEFCAPCRAAERVITDAVAEHDGVGYVDLDSAEKLDLTRRLNILRTPTVVITDRTGRVVHRTAGVPTKQSLQESVQAALSAGASR